MLFEKSFEKLNYVEETHFKKNESIILELK